MNYFENLLNKGAELQLLDEKMLMKKRSISSLKELRKRLIQIGEVEKENTEVLNKIIQFI